MARVSITVNDYAFETLIEGEGPPVLFVHGSVADLTTFTTLSRRLRASYRCISYSRRFHPPNCPPGADDVYDTARHAEELLDIIARTNSAPVVMVGSSFGAFIGLISALRAPEAFRALVLCEPPMVPLLLHHPQGKPLHEGFVHGVMEPARSCFREGKIEDGLKIFVEGVRGQPGWFDRLSPAMKDDLLRFGPELRAEFLTAHSTYMYDVSLESLHSLLVPTLLVGGELSKPMFKAILDVLQSSIGHAERTEIPRAGHLLHLQNPVLFTSRLRDFLLRH